MSTKETVYVKIGGAWHAAETGHALPAPRRPAVKLACTGALVARGFPETSAKPPDACKRCENPPDAATLDRAHQHVAKVASTRALATGKRKQR